MWDCAADPYAQPLRALSITWHCWPHPLHQWHCAQLHPNLCTGNATQLLPHLAPYLTSKPFSPATDIVDKCWAVTRPVLFIFFLNYWQVTLIWSPYGDASLIRSFTYWWHVHHLLYWHGYLSWLWRRNGLLLFFCYLSLPPLFPLRIIPLCWFRTIVCLLIHADSSCTIMTHTRILVLGPGGCTMTHGLSSWLALFTLVCYRLCVLNYKYPVVAVVGP